ncbi:hypothetical protein GW626_09075 [Peribacillus muralis]|uniref:hypothetical protein n=1 Tax=Peribacillus muralis TaxID=264697 RepID=UPI001F4E55F3|nr:hypothetical protein [Peribacillus muralis]MCK1993783.1 hypothetical protein [Peribacillus muralis]MCK2013928.1 hypothetical protein [Peribacillus muralis]
MDTILYFCFSLVYMILFIMGITLIRRQDNLLSHSSFLLLVTFALFADNIIIASGKFIGDGPLLEVLNQSRFWIHGFITPTLILFGWQMAKRIHIPFTEKRSAFYFFLILTSGLIIYECFENMHKTFVPVSEYGVLRYVSEQSSGPPLMVLVVSLVLLVISINIFLRARWIWMLIGVVIMIGGSAIPIPIKSSAITNAFEMIFICSLWYTYYKLEPHFPHSDSSLVLQQKRVK